MQNEKRWGSFLVVTALCLVISLCMIPAASAQVVDLFKDINPGSGHSFPDDFTEFNGALFFGADEGTNGMELWTSDGTAAGTALFKDINPGSGSSNPSYFAELNGALFFRADDGTNGSELWTSDGTAAGTMLVKDIRPGSGSSNPIGFTEFNGALFFRADDGTNGSELWTSDGTAAGTMLVKDIRPGSGHSGSFGFTEFNGALFFGANDGTNGRELWTSDGTAAGTVLFKDINPGSGGSFPYGFSEFNGALFFGANDGISGCEPWKLGQPTPEEALDALTELVESLGLSSELENALVTKLDHAAQSLAMGNTGAAINQLGAFINQVEAKRGNPLTEAQADALIAAAQAIIDAINAAAAPKRGEPVTEVAGVPETFALYGAYPNPFNPQTTLRFAVPEASSVRLVVYNMLGRQVRVLVEGRRQAGTHEVVFEAGALPSGTYLVRLATPQGSYAQMVQLVK